MRQLSPEQYLFLRYYQLFLFSRILWLRKIALENAQNRAEDTESYKDPTGHCSVGSSRWNDGRHQCGRENYLKDGEMRNGMGNGSRFDGKIMSFEESQKKTYPVSAAFTEGFFSFFGISPVYKAATGKDLIYPDKPVSTTERVFAGADAALTFTGLGVLSKVGRTGGAARSELSPGTTFLNFQKSTPATPFNPKGMVDQSKMSVNDAFILMPGKKGIPISEAGMGYKQTGISGNLPDAVILSRPKTPIIGEMMTPEKRQSIKDAFK